MPLIKHPSANLFILILLLITLSFIYSPLLTGEHVISDDWYFFEWRGLKTHASLWFGRPLHAIMMDVVYAPLIQRVKDGNLARFINILGLSIFAFAMYIFFKTYIEELHALLLSLTIATLPPFQSYAASIVCGPYFYGLFFSVCSFLLARKTIDSPHLALKAKIICVIVSVFLLLMALATFQPVGMFFTAMLVFWILNTESTDFKWRKTASFGAILCGTLLLYLFLWIFLLHYTGSPIQMQAGGYGIFDRVYDPRFLETNFFRGKLFWFLDASLVIALHLWIADWSSKIDMISGATIVIIALGPGLELLTLFKMQGQKGRELSRNLANFICKYLIVLVLIPLSTIATLTSRTHITEYRVLPGLMAIILMLVYWGIAKIIRILPVKLKSEIMVTILASAAIFGAFKSAGVAMTFYTMLPVMELRYIKGEIERYQGKDKVIPEVIHVILPGEDLHKPIGQYYDFMPPNVSQVDPLRIPLIIRQMLREMGVDPEKNNVRISYGRGLERDESVSKDGMLIIDMMRLYY